MGPEGYMIRVSGIIPKKKKKRERERVREREEGRKGKGTITNSVKQSLAN